MIIIEKYSIFYDLADIKSFFSIFYSSFKNDLIQKTNSLNVI